MAAIGKAAHAEQQCVALLPMAQRKTGLGREQSFECTSRRIGASREFEGGESCPGIREQPIGGQPCAPIFGQGKIHGDVVIPRQRLAQLANQQRVDVSVHLVGRHQDPALDRAAEARTQEIPDAQQASRGAQGRSLRGCEKHRAKNTAPDEDHVVHGVGGQPDRVPSREYPLTVSGRGADRAA